MSQGLTIDLFVNPGVDLNLGDPGYREAVNFTKEDLRRRWATPYGVNILARWKASEFDRASLEQLVGKVYGYLVISEESPYPVKRFAMLT
ncbi:MAG: hypothetical protein WBB28_05800 [Crinalium sp.]